MLKCSILNIYDKKVVRVIELLWVNVLNYEATCLQFPFSVSLSLSSVPMVEFKKYGITF